MCIHNNISLHLEMRIQEVFSGRPEFHMGLLKEDSLFGGKIIKLLLEHFIFSKLPLIHNM